VKFRLAGVQMISACPNCAMIAFESEAPVGIREIFEQAPSIQPQQLEHR
jgi:hypothetical protein